MMLVTLELLIRSKIRIFVIQVDNIANRDKRLAIIPEVVEESAAIAILAHHRPAEGMLDKPLREILFGHGPDLFQTNAVFLWIACIPQAKLRSQFLGKGPSRTFGKENIFAKQFHTRLVI